jgi:hypothetical protein
MKMRNRFPDLILFLLLLLLAAALVYPLKPSPLPLLPSRANPPVSPVQDVLQRDPDPQPSIAETAALFISHRPHPSPRQARKVSTPPEKVPWLHFIAFVVASSEKRVYFFKNDQTGHVLMLTYNQPREGWNLTRIQGVTYILEKDDHSYVVSEK